MLGADRVLQSLLDVPAEVMRVDGVDAAVHETEAVGRADDRFTINVEDRAAMDGDAFQVAAEALPRVSEFRFNGG